MGKFTTENQPTIRKSRKGVKNKSTVLRETYFTLFNDSLIGLNPKELLRITVEKILIKDNVTSSELELLVKVSLSLLPYEIEQQKQELIKNTVNKKSVHIVDTNELLESFKITGDTNEK